MIVSTTEHEDCPYLGPKHKEPCLWCAFLNLVETLIVTEEISWDHGLFHTEIGAPPK